MSDRYIRDQASDDASNAATVILGLLILGCWIGSIIVALHFVIKYW